jgi:tRNA (adenine57-N1/adenine58-N1)-methyltransferase
VGAALEQVVDARRGAARVSLPRPTRGSGRSSRTQQIVDVSAGELVVGERVMLIDAKDRRYLITLREGAAFHTHAGIIQHDDLIGTVEGSLVRGNTERSFLVLRPTLSDVVLKMPRGAQVIYPKDLGTILMQADIGPGMRVLEAGVGSGALSMTLLRAGAHITGYEIREDFAQQATTNVHDMLGTDVPYHLQIRDVTLGIDEEDLDRVLLDMPEPWAVVKHAERALRPGGIFLAYLPTINQTQLLRETLRQHSFGMEETVEILRRTWHIDGRSVRPDHRMVAHTGFLTSARRLVRRVESD